MNITDLSNLYRSQQYLQSTSATQTDPVQKAFASAAARLNKEQQTTSVQVSAVGQVKAGFARVEDAGKALASTQPTTTTADIKKGLQALVSAYNDARSAATSATTDSGRTRTAANDLRRAVATDSSRTDLRSLGITQQQDGSLTLDSKVLDKALQSNPDSVRTSAARIGSQLQQTASRALSDSGSVGATLNTLNARAQNIEARLAEQQNLATASQQTVQQRSASASSFLGINSYQNIFSL